MWWNFEYYQTKNMEVPASYDFLGKVTKQIVCNAPPPSDSGKWKWRFMGIPYQRCNNPGGDCYVVGHHLKKLPSYPRSYTHISSKGQGPANAKFN